MHAVPIAVFFASFLALVSLVVVVVEASGGVCSSALCNSVKQNFSTSVCVELIGCSNLSAEIQLVTSNVTCVVFVAEAAVASLSITLGANSLNALLNVTVLRTVIRGTATTAQVALLAVMNAGSYSTIPATISLYDVNMSLTNASTFSSSTPSIALISVGSGAKLVNVTRCRFELYPPSNGPSLAMLLFPLGGAASNLALTMVDTTFLVLGSIQTAPLSAVLLAQPVSNSVFIFSGLVVNWTVWLTSSGYGNIAHSCMICFNGPMTNSAVTVQDTKLTFYGRFPENGYVSGVSIVNFETTNVSLSVVRHLMDVSCWGFGVPALPLVFANIARCFAIRTGTAMINMTILLIDSNISMRVVPFQLGIGTMAVTGAEVRGTYFTIFVVRSNMTLNGRVNQWMCNFGDPLNFIELLVLNVSLTLTSNYSRTIDSSTTSHAVYFGGFAVNRSSLTFRNFIYSSTAHVESVSAVKNYAVNIATIVHTVGPNAQYINMILLFENVSASYRVTGSRSNQVFILVAVAAANESSMINTSFTLERSVVTMVMDDVLAGGLGVFQICLTDPMSNLSFSVRNSNVSINAASTLGYLVGGFGFTSLQVNALGFQQSNFVTMCNVSLIDSNISMAVRGYIGSASIIGVLRTNVMAAIVVTNLTSSIVVISANSKTSPWPSHFGFVGSTVTGSSMTVVNSTIEMTCTLCLIQNEIGLASTSLNGFQLSVRDTHFSLSRPAGSTPIGHVAFTGLCAVGGGASFEFVNVTSVATVATPILSFSVESYITGVSALTVKSVSSDPGGDASGDDTANALMTIPSSIAGRMTITLSKLSLPAYSDGVIGVAGSSAWPPSADVTFVVCNWRDSQLGGSAFPPGRGAFPAVPPRNFAAQKPLASGNGSSDSEGRCRASSSVSATESVTRPLKETVTASYRPVRRVRKAAGAVLSTRVAVAATGVVMAAAVPGAGFAIQRAMSQIALSGGSTFDPTAMMSVSDSPTQMNFGNPVYGPMRGCVIGNMALWAAACVVGLGVSVALSVKNNVGVRVAASRLGLPGKLSIPFDLLLQPTISSALTLIMYRQGNGDVLLGLGGVAACCLWFGLWVYGFRTLVAYPGKPKQNDEGEAKPGEGTAVVAVLMALRPVRYLKEIACEWGSKSLPDRLAFDSFIPRFEDYGPMRQWFLGVEIGSAIGLALLTAYMQSPNDDTPQTPLTAGNLTVCVLVLLSCIAWAHNERMARLNYLSTAVISLLSAALASGNLPDVADAVAVSQVYLSMFATAINVLDASAMILIRAARLHVTVMTLITSKLGAASDALLQSEAAAAAKAEEEQRQLQPVTTLEELYHEGIVLPRPKLRPHEIKRNLEILVKHITNSRAGSSAKRGEMKRQRKDERPPAASTSKAEGRPRLRHDLL